MQAFNYAKPSSLADAARAAGGNDAKLLAGGQSLLAAMKLGLAAPAALVDLGGLKDLQGITVSGGTVKIGAMTTHAAVAASKDVQQAIPALAQLAAGIGDRQVRNWGTIGGSIAHADPASDWPALLLAGNATVVCRSQSGERLIKARDFFLDTFQTAIEPTEVLTEVRLMRRPKLSGGAYTKLERKVGDFATAGAAVFVALGGDGKFARAGVGITGVAECPFAATDAEAILAGNAPSEELFRSAGNAAGAQARPVADVRGPIEYKRAMAAELTVRSLRSAVARALSYA
jgi:carbon-monoxide dehydrogenase medium subunit